MLDLGLLHLLYAAVSMIFWRVFMRISYSCPAHLKFGLTIDQWSQLVTLTGEAIDWLEANEHLYDVWMLVAYAATSCALVQVCNDSRILTGLAKAAHTTIFFKFAVSHLGAKEGRRCASKAAQVERLCPSLGEQFAA